MAWGYRELRGPEERRASKLPIPPGLSRSMLNLTVLEDEAGARSADQYHWAAHSNNGSIPGSRAMPPYRLKPRSSQSRKESSRSSKGKVPALAAQ
jgi:hypothetical protein